MFGRTERLWGETSSLKSAYDAVIIGGRPHGDGSCDLEAGAFFGIRPAGEDKFMEVIRK